MEFVSDFADQAVMLPLALVVLTGLGVSGCYRAAVAWSVAVFGTFGLILLLKAGSLYLMAVFGSDYRFSPSGHVAAASVVYGGLAVLLLWDAVPRVCIAAATVAAALVIGYSRISLGAHTLAEVLTGAGIGFGGLGIFTVSIGPRPRVAQWPLPVVASVTILVLHGFHLPAEEAIRLASMSW